VQIDVPDEPQQTRPERQRLLNLPPMVTALILFNVAVHVVRWLLPTDVDDALVTSLAFVPLRYMVPEYFTWRSLLSPIGHQFLHASIGHLLMNMVFLAAFGSAVERRTGPWRMLVFTLICGMSAALLHLVVYGHDPVGVIGFSGAGSGLFGAALALPMPSGYRSRRQRIIVIGGIWIVLNVVLGYTGMAIGGDDNAPIAWVAHIGGFIAGVALIDLFVPRKRAEPDKQ
jgi:membrane associated rhomboid family serine protease